MSIVSRLRKGFTSFAATGMFAGFVSLLERIDDVRPDLLRVLTYHRVDWPDAHPGLSPDLLSATPDAFEQQMQYVASHYNVLPVSAVLERYRNGKPLPPRSLLITFDDAYQDFVEHAWPTLKRYALATTVFVPTSFPGQPERSFWWDHLYHIVSTTSMTSINTPHGHFPLGNRPEREQAYVRLKEQVKSLPHAEAMEVIGRISAEARDVHEQHHVLGWDALRQLAREGVTLGAHTRTHPLLNRISADEIRAEAVGSLRDLEREIGSTLPIFAYPSGGFDDEGIRVLSNEGFVLAFTTMRGINDLRRANPLRLRRINVGRRTAPALLKAQLLPWTAWSPAR